MQLFCKKKNRNTQSVKILIKKNSTYIFNCGRRVNNVMRFLNKQLVWRFRGSDFSWIRHSNHLVYCRMCEWLRKSAAEMHRISLDHNQLGRLKRRRKTNITCARWWSFFTLLVAKHDSDGGESRTFTSQCWSTHTKAMLEFCTFLESCQKCAVL